VFGFPFPIPAMSRYVGALGDPNSPLCHPERSVSRFAVSAQRGTPKMQIVTMRPQGILTGILERRGLVVGE
jgi:hypothetical protein